MTTKQHNMIRLYSTLESWGFTRAEVSALRRIESTLRRWGELECGNGNDYASWSIERDETTEKPFMVTHPHTGKTTRRPIADRERGALKRLGKLMEPYKCRFVAYHQGDPRGCALYIIPKKEIPKDTSVESMYNRGIAVCV